MPGAVGLAAAREGIVARGSAGGQIIALGHATQSGLPLGDAAFVEEMERRFERELRRQLPGPKPKRNTLAARA